MSSINNLAYPIRDFLILFLLVLFFNGCERTVDVSVNSPLMNCSAKYLNFRDNHLFLDANYAYPPSNSGENKIYFEYQDGKIIRVRGGFDLVAAGNNLLENLIFSEAISDSLVHQGNRSYVYTRPERTYTPYDQPENPIIYETNDQGRLIKVTRRNGKVLYYAWDKDQVIEMSKDEQPIRTFFLSEGNLSRVEKVRKGREGRPISKKEMVFRKYDDAPNPLENKYYILGAFYRAFSKSNYREMTINKYNWENEEWVWNSSYSVEVNIHYNRQGQPLLGDYSGKPTA